MSSRLQDEVDDVIRTYNDDIVLWLAATYEDIYRGFKVCILIILNY